MKSLGMIETRGLVGAIEAGDCAVKTANVEILNKHLIGGGLVSIEIVGDIGAVKVAIESAVEVTKRMGVYIGSNVIARPSEEIVEKLLQKKTNIIEEKKEAKEVKEVKEVKKVKSVKVRKDTNKK